MAADHDPPVYRGMTRAALDAAYNNRAAVADSEDWLAGWRQDSKPVRARPGVMRDLRYGAAARASLDYFPSGQPGAPLFIFFHGGYWMRNDKEMFAFAAEGPLAAGFDVAMVGYTLAPEARLSAIVAEAVSAADFLAREAGPLGFAPNKVIAGGWSAGGHLATMLCGHPLISAVLAISGIYDLEPIALCYVNDALRLSPDEVDRLSPLRALRASPAPIALAYGTAELAELQRQSADFADICVRRGQRARLLPLSGHNHFSILEELRAPSGRLVQEIGQLAAGGV